MPIYNPPNPDAIFQPNIAGQIAPFLGQMGDSVSSAMKIHKQKQMDSMTLKDFMKIDDATAPENMKPFLNMPVGRLKQLHQALGGSLAPLMQQKPQAGLWWDPKAKTFGMGEAPEGAVPVHGATSKDAVSALKKPAGNVSFKPEDVTKVADRIQHGDFAYIKQISAFGGGFKNAVTAELANRGVDITNMQLDFEAKQSYTKTINSPAFQNTLKFLQSVRPNMDKLIELSDKVGRTFLKPLNRVQLESQAKTGRGDVAAYAAAAIEVQDQIAKILQGGGTGNATSDAKLKQAGEVLSKDYAPNQIKAVATMLKGMLQERENAMKTNTYQSMSNQKAPPKDPAVVFAEIKKKNPTWTKAQIYAAMHKQGL